MGLLPIYCLYFFTLTPNPPQISSSPVIGPFNSEATSTPQHFNLKIYRWCCVYAWHPHYSMFTRFLRWKSCRPPVLVWDCVVVWTGKMPLYEKKKKPIGMDVACDATLLCWCTVYNRSIQRSIDHFCLLKTLKRACGACWQSVFV